MSYRKPNPWQSLQATRRHNRDMRLQERTGLNAVERAQRIFQLKDELNHNAIFGHIEERDGQAQKLIEREIKRLGGRV